MNIYKITFNDVYSIYAIVNLTDYTNNLPILIINPDTLSISKINN